MPHKSILKRSLWLHSFLAAKKADREFGVSQQSGRHTVREAITDITRMAEHLTEHQVTTVMSSHTTPPFHDATEDGWKKTYQV